MRQVVFLCFLSNIQWLAITNITVISVYAIQDHSSNLTMLSIENDRLGLIDFKDPIDEFVVKKSQRKIVWPSISVNVILNYETDFCQNLENDNCY